VIFSDLNYSNWWSRKIQHTWPLSNVNDIFLNLLFLHEFLHSQSKTLPSLAYAIRHVLYFLLHHIATNRLTTIVYKITATLFRLKTAANFLNMCWVKIARASAWLRKPASIQLFFAICLVHIRTKSSTPSLHSPKLPNASPRMRPNVLKCAVTGPPPPLIY
jgi:hypothetical protein